MNQENIKTNKTFMMVSIIIFIAKVLGFVRDIVMASVFGTTVLADVFLAIFSLPSLLFSSIGNAFSFVNVPNLTHYLHNHSYEERNNYLVSLYAKVSLGSVLISLMGIVFAPMLARLIVPGIYDEMSSLSILLTRIMMVSLLFVTLTYITNGVLQVHGYFMLSASVSIPFNFLIVAVMLFRGQNIILLGYITTIGWLLQFLIQLPVLFKEKYSFKYPVNWKNERTENMFKHLVPILMGNSLLQLCMVIDRTIFATHLSQGTSAALGFGGTLFITMTGIFIIALSTVIFPRLSDYCLNENYYMIRSILNYSFKMLLFILIPYLLLVIIFSYDIVALLYQRGAFNAASTQLTATAFLCYSFAVIGYACQEVFNRVYYALKRFTVPMYASLACLLLHLVLNIFLSRLVGIAGLALSTALVMLIYGVIMAFMVYRIIGSFLGPDFGIFLVRLLLPLSGMAGTLIVCRHFFTVGLFPTFLLPLFLSGIVYLFLAWWGGLTKEILLKE